MRRMAASPAAPIPAHRPAHFRRHDCRRHCRRFRRPARHGASQSLPRTTIRGCPRSCRPGRPLKRRAAPLRRVPRRRFPDPPFSANQASDPPGRALGLTPDAAGCGCAHARAKRALRHSFAALGRLPASLSCRIERVSVRYTRFLMGRACPCRSVSPTDTRTDTRGPGIGHTDRYTPVAAPLKILASAVGDRYTRDMRGISGVAVPEPIRRETDSLSRRRPRGAIPGRTGPRRPAFQARPRGLREPSRPAFRSPGAGVQRNIRSIGGAIEPSTGAGSTLSGARSAPPPRVPREREDALADELQVTGFSWPARRA